MAVGARLMCLFAFMLCCAAVYYASQFHIAHNYGGDVEKKRALARSRLKDAYDIQAMPWTVTRADTPKFGQAPPRRSTRHTNTP